MCISTTIKSCRQVLVHEATFEDSMADDARAKKHCTVSEAIDVGLRMGGECSSALF